jgi:hypothetical protein
MYPTYTYTDLNRGCGSSQTGTLAVPSFPNPKSKIQNSIIYTYSFTQLGEDMGLKGWGLCQLGVPPLHPVLSQVTIAIPSLETEIVILEVG